MAPAQPFPDRDNQRKCGLAVLVVEFNVSLHT